jgi:hypothetical protein
MVCRPTDRCSAELPETNRRAAPATGATTSAGVDQASASCRATSAAGSPPDHRVALGMMLTAGHKWAIALHRILDDIDRPGTLHRTRALHRRVAYR